MYVKRKRQVEKNVTFQIRGEKSIPEGLMKMKWQK